MSCGAAWAASTTCLFSRPHPSPNVGLVSEKSLKLLTNDVNVFQELEQEKYHLRRRLEGVEEEYELKVTELQTDISGLRNILQQTEVNTRQAEREKSLLITQLSEQNQRLTTQLKDVSSGHNEGEIKAESEQTIVCLIF